jgi:hypothetical protein
MPTFLRGPLSRQSHARMICNLSSLSSEHGRRLQQRACATGQRKHVDHASPATVATDGGDGDSDSSQVAAYMGSRVGDLYDEQSDSCRGQPMTTRPTSMCFAKGVGSSIAPRQQRP